MLAVTENQETQRLLDGIQRQPSVFVLSGPATVITNIATASAFQADGWSTESVSHVVRTARNRQENNEKERAEHAYYSHKHDEVTISDSFTVTGQRLGEDENLPEDTTAQDDQEDETEQSLSDSLQTRRQISKIHENMGHPSDRTLVRVLMSSRTRQRSPTWPLVTCGDSTKLSQNVHTNGLLSIDLRPAHAVSKVHGWIGWLSSSLTRKVDASLGTTASFSTRQHEKAQ